MSTKFKVPGALWKGAAIRSAVRPTLYGFHKLGVDMDASILNWAKGMPNAALYAPVTAPVVAEGYVGFKSGSCYLTTSIPDTGKFTTIAVFRSEDAVLGTPTAPVILGNYSSTPALYGASMFLSSGPLLSGSVNLDNSGTPSLAQVSVACTTPSNWRLASHMFDGTTQTITDHTNNLSANATTALSRVLSTNNMRIGSGYSSFAGTSQIAAVARFGRALSPTELGYMVDQLRALAAADGIVV